MITIKEDIQETHTFSLLVDNEAGVLARVIGLFSGRGYNIESLTVAEVDKDSHTSRITIVSKGSPKTIDQIKRHLERLVPVHKVTDLTIEGPSVEREMALIKVLYTNENKEERKERKGRGRGGKGREKKKGGKKEGKGEGGRRRKGEKGGKEKEKEKEKRRKGGSRKQTRPNGSGRCGQHIEDRTHGDDGPADRIINLIAKADLVLQVGGAENDVERRIDE